jgi:peptidoglycan-N-acetylglucosamine deacetylase
MKKSTPTQPLLRRYSGLIRRYRFGLVLCCLIALVTISLSGNQWWIAQSQPAVHTSPSTPLPLQSPNPAAPVLPSVSPSPIPQLPAVVPIDPTLPLQSPSPVTPVLPSASPSPTPQPTATDQPPAPTDQTLPSPTAPIPPSVSPSPTPQPKATDQPPAPTDPTLPNNLPNPAVPVSPPASPSPTPQPTASPSASPSPSPAPPKPKPPVSTNSLSIPAQFRGKIIRMISLLKKEKLVALTFDDGPWTSTAEVVEILKKHKIKATFFWIGKHLQMYPEIAKKVVADGHTIGNHTWSHLYKSMDQDQVKAEVDNTTASIYKKTGAKTVFFRPPGGELKNGLVEYAAGKKYVTALWSVSPGDAKKGATSEKIVSDVVENARSGSVILLHDGGGDRTETLKALPEIIRQLRGKGFKFVSLPELLRMPGAKAKS